MKPQKHQLLSQKGWTEKEIQKAAAILETTHNHDVFLSKIVFWSALTVIIFANLIISLILIPFLVIFGSWIVYSIVSLLALCIGFLYHFLITDLGHLDKKHHLLASIITPIIAIVNMIIMVIVSNNFIKQIDKPLQTHNPWAIAIVFAITFILPTIFFNLFNRK